MQALFVIKFPALYFAIGREAAGSPVFVGFGVLRRQVILSDVECNLIVTH